MDWPRRRLGQIVLIAAGRFALDTYRDEPDRAIRGAQHATIVRDVGPFRNQRGWARRRLGCGRGRSEDSSKLTSTQIGWLINGSRSPFNGLLLLLLLFVCLFCVFVLRCNATRRYDDQRP